MKKFAKALRNFAGFAFMIYIGIFFLWLLLEISCLDYARQKGWSAAECRQDSLSQMVRTTHAPLFALMFGSDKK